MACPLAPCIVQGSDRGGSPPPSAPGMHHALSKWWLSFLLEKHGRQLALGSILGQHGRVAQETWIFATEITVTSTCKRRSMKTQLIGKTTC